MKLLSCFVLVLTLADLETKGIYLKYYTAYTILLLPIYLLGEPEK